MEKKKKNFEDWRKKMVSLGVLGVLGALGVSALLAF
jgi:hypothetical protein